MVSIEETITELSGNNFGAASVLIALAESGKQNCFSLFKQHNIRGSKIWMLWKDVCGSNETKLHDLLDLLVSAGDPREVTYLVARMEREMKVIDYLSSN